MATSSWYGSDDKTSPQCKQWGVMQVSCLPLGSNSSVAEVAFRPGCETVIGWVVLLFHCSRRQTDRPCVDVLLTVHLGIFILVINQLDAQKLFYNKFISCLYMFRAPCAHRQEVRNCIIQLLVSSHLQVAVLCTGRPPTECEDTRDCIIQFCPPDGKHMCSKHVEAWNKLIIKFSASSRLILR